MKLPKSFRIEESLLVKLEKWAGQEHLNLSQAIESIIEKFDYSGYNLDKFVKVLTYNPKYQSAATFNKENMDLILSVFKEFKDAQHFINKMVFIYANKAVNSEVSSKGLITSDGRADINSPKMNDKIKNFLLKEDKKLANKLGISEVDSEGNPIYEDSAQE